MKWLLKLFLDYLTAQDRVRELRDDNTQIKTKALLSASNRGGDVS